MIRDDDHRSAHALSMVQHDLGMALHRTIRQHDDGVGAVERKQFVGELGTHLGDGATPVPDAPAVELGVFSQIPRRTDSPPDDAVGAQENVDGPIEFSSAYRFAELGQSLLRHRNVVFQHVIGPDGGPHPFFGRRLRRELGQRSTKVPQPAVAERLGGPDDRGVTGARQSSKLFGVEHERLCSRRQEVFDDPALSGSQVINLLELKDRNVLW